jgi:transposase
MSNLMHIGLALGGKAGARLADKLAMSASASTLLRLLHQLETPPVAVPRIIGIDDWAFRKGRDYGTIIVDHESGKPIDLLPARDCETVRQWLEKHPTVEIITRDRSGEYREAIDKTLPEAMQIADRWHLLKNLREAVQRHLSRRYRTVRKLVVDAAVTQGKPDDTSHIANRRRYAPGPAREMIHAARKAKREALYEAVNERYKQGVYMRDIAREFNLSRPTVSRWVKSESLTPDARGRYKRKCLIDEYESYLRQRLADGCTNKSQLWREICRQGFTGSRSLVGKWIRQHCRPIDEPGPPLAPSKANVAVPSPTELSWLLMRSDDELDAEEERLVEVLVIDTRLHELRQLAHQFIHMVRHRLSHQWSPWLASVQESAVKELKNYAIGLKRDAAAVYAAIEQPWSNGTTEGNVNRLKFLKRQMYGRASFDLLRLRVLCAA